jgi:hypothetical protein
MSKVVVIELIGWDKRAYPEAKVPFSFLAEALGYLDATATATTKTTAKGKDRSRSSACGEG